MKLLIDTHIFIWWESDTKRLSSIIQEALLDSENIIYLSIASIWELQIKLQMGKMKLSQPLPDKVKRQQEENNLQILSIQPKHIYTLSELANHHRDPFDRLLIAQAKYEKMTLVTVDKQIQAYDVITLW